jgi:hypothetical protein
MKTLFIPKNLIVIICAIFALLFSVFKSKSALLNEYWNFTLVIILVAFLMYDIFVNPIFKNYKKK